MRPALASLALIVLDTQWWLHHGPKPLGPDSTCPEKTEEDVTRALESALAGAGDRRVVVVGHHPFASGGPHGGHFTWKDHLFPLVYWKKWLWLPLPIVGSAYPLSRQTGIASNQDFAAGAYERMRRALEGAFASAPPLVYASGHEHGLQVLRGRVAKYQVVSGAGAYGHLTTVDPTAGTLFAGAVSGYVRLDVGRDGAVRLSVVTVDAAGRVGEGFYADLSP